MSVFKDEVETKRVIFNVRLDLALRLEKAKEDARMLGKKLDADGTVDKAMEKFLRKAERKIAEMKAKGKGEGIVEFQAVEDGGSEDAEGSVQGEVAPEDT